MQAAQSTIDAENEFTVYFLIYLWHVYVCVSGGTTGGGDKPKIDQTLRGRFTYYIHNRYFGPSNEPLGIKLWAMVDAMSRGFKIEARYVKVGRRIENNTSNPMQVIVRHFSCFFCAASASVLRGKPRPCLCNLLHTPFCFRFNTDMEATDVQGFETDILNKYDFALNDTSNEDYRWPIAIGTSGKKVTDYEVVNQDEARQLAEYAVSLKFGLMFNGKLKDGWKLKLIPSVVPCDDNEDVELQAAKVGA